MSTQTLDPRLAARLAARAGDVYRECCPGPQKQLASAERLSRQRISQVVHGDPTGWPARTYAGVYQLARGDRTNPTPLLTDLRRLAVEVAYQDRPTSWLAAEYGRLCDLEHGNQAAQDRALQRSYTVGDVAGAARAARQHADALLEIAAVAQLLAERSVDVRARVA